MSLPEEWAQPVRLHDDRDALEERPAQRPPADRESLPLAIREPETAAAEHLVEHPILLAEVVDRVLLTAVQESSEDRDGEKQRGSEGGAFRDRTPASDDRDRA